MPCEAVAGHHRISVSAALRDATRTRASGTRSGSAARGRKARKEPSGLPELLLQMAKPAEKLSVSVPATAHDRCDVGSDHAASRASSPGQCSTSLAEVEREQRQREEPGLGHPPVRVVECYSHSRVDLCATQRPIRTLCTATAVALSSIRSLDKGGSVSDSTRRSIAQHILRNHPEWGNRTIARAVRAGRDST